MRLTFVAAKGILSFDDFHLPLELQRTVIVGPNGSGKTNVGRLIELCVRSLQRADRDSPDLQAVMNEFLGARHFGQPGPIEVRLGYELDSPDEHHLVATFVRAAIQSSVTAHWGGVDFSTAYSWVSTQVTEQKLSELYQGEIVVTHRGTEDARWLVAVDFDAVGPTRKVTAYRWQLLSDRGEGLVTRSDLGQLNLSGVQLADRLRPQGGKPGSSPAGVFALRRILPRLKTTIPTQVDLPGNPPPPSVEELMKLLGVSQVRTNRYMSFASVLSHILRQKLITTSDQRLVPISTQSWSEPNAALRTGAEAHLPEMLFLLKNGGPRDQARFQDVRAFFKSMTHGRELEISAPPKPQDPTNPQDGLLVAPQVLVTVGTIPPTTTDTAQWVPIQFAGAGAWEAMALSAVVASHEHNVALLDEPAVALHPTLQRALRAKLAQSDVQTIMVTHSPYLLPLDDDRHDTQIVRIDRSASLASVPHSVASEMLDKMAGKLRAKGNERLPFSWRAVLCEGELDVLAVRILSGRLGIDVDDLNIAVLDCGGRTNLPDYIVFCGQLGLPHVVLADADAATAAIKPETARQVAAVRSAADAEPLASLVELPENLETSLGARAKRHLAIQSAADTVTIARGAPPEIQALLDAVGTLATH